MFNETLLEEGYAQVYIVSPNDKYENRFEEAQEEAQVARRGIWALTASEQALLTDRGNGVGGDGCLKEQPETPPEAPPAVPEPDPDPLPEPDLPSVTPTPTPKQNTPSTPPSSGRSSGADCSTGAKDVPVIPGSKGGGDDEGIGCETQPWIAPVHYHRSYRSKKGSASIRVLMCLHIQLL